MNQIILITYQKTLSPTFKWRLWIAIIIKHLFPFTYGGEYPSILDDLFSSFKGLDLQGIDL